MSKIIAIPFDSNYQPTFAQIIAATRLKPYFKDNAEVHHLFKRRLLLSYLDPNPWQAILKNELFDSDFFSRLLQDCKYKCPYTSHTYTSFVPTVIHTNDIEKYFKEGHPMQEIASDDDWNNTYHAELLEGNLTHIETLLLGSGYTQATRINDGGVNFERVMLQLSNSDYLEGTLITWSNK